MPFILSWSLINDKQINGARRIRKNKMAVFYERGKKTYAIKIWEPNIWWKEKKWVGYIL